jgi:hypothetical protein
VIPKTYNILPNKFFSSGAKEAVKVPKLSLKKLVIPTKMQAQIFSILSTQEISLTDLVKKFAETNNVSLTPYKIKTLKTLFLYHLGELTDKNLVLLNKHGRKLYIKLTSTGKLIHKVMQSEKAEKY